MDAESGLARVTLNSRLKRSHWSSLTRPAEVIATMAASNKCLAHFNKSGMRAKGTKKCVADITATDLAAPGARADAEGRREEGRQENEAPQVTDPGGAPPARWASRRDPAA